MLLEQNGGVLALSGQVLLDNLEFYISTGKYNTSSTPMHHFYYKSKQLELFTECIKYINHSLKDYYTQKFGRPYLNNLNTMVIYYTPGNIYDYNILETLGTVLTTENNLLSAKALYTMIYFAENIGDDILNYYDLIPSVELKLKQGVNPYFIERIKATAIMHLHLKPSSKTQTFADLEYQINYYVSMYLKKLTEQSYKEFKIGKKYLHTLVFNKIISHFKKYNIKHVINKKMGTITINLIDTSTKSKETKVFKFSNLINQSLLLIRYFIMCEVNNRNDTCFLNDNLYHFFENYYPKGYQTSNIYNANNLSANSARALTVENVNPIYRKPYRRLNNKQNASAAAVNTSAAAVNASAAAVNASAAAVNASAALNNNYESNNNTATRIAEFERIAAARRMTRPQNQKIASAAAVVNASAAAVNPIKKKARTRSERIAALQKTKPTKKAPPIPVQIKNESSAAVNASAAAVNTRVTRTKKKLRPTRKAPSPPRK
jgi:hypothetical protein